MRIADTISRPVVTLPRLLCLFVCLTLFGCGSSGPEVVRVYGKVTLDGGPVPADGTLYFLPVSSESGAASRPSSAAFDAAGNYEVKSFGDRKGLPPGKYQVYVECWKTPPEMQGPPPVSYLPPRYDSAATSNLELTIEPGAGSVEFNVPLESE